MCGFVVTTDVNNTELMLSKQAFRGPDAQSFYKDKYIGMGHALLDINGESKYNHIKLKMEIILFLMEKCMIQQ